MVDLNLASGMFICSSLLILCGIRYTDAYRLMHRPMGQNRRYAISVNGAMQEMEAMSAAFIGGTVGIMGTLVALEIKNTKDLSLESCPYCMGHGKILCGTCLGSCKVDGGPCPNCGATGDVLCINCKGDGRLTPIVFQNKKSREPDSEYTDSKKPTIERA